MRVWPLGPIHFTDGTSIELPRIDVERGWIMRPDEARTESEIRRDINKSFGRVIHRGEQAAKDWYHQYLAHLQLMHGHKTVLSLGFSGDPTMTGMGDSVYVEYEDPRWGKIGTGIRFERQENREVRRTSWFRAAQLAFEWPNMTIDNIDHLSAWREVEFGSLVRSHERTFEDIASWVDDPWAQARDMYPEYSFPDEDYSIDTSHPNPVQVTGVARIYLDKGYGLKVFTDSAEALADLGSYYGHLGVTAQVKYSWNYGRLRNQSEVDSVIFDIDGNENVHNKLGHRIVLRSNGMEIRCGYHEDEERWAEYQKRLAEDYLGQILASENDEPAPKASYEEYEIDMSNDPLKEETN